MMMGEGIPLEPPLLRSQQVLRLPLGCAGVCGSPLNTQATQELCFKSLYSKERLGRQASVVIQRWSGNK